MSFVLTDLNSIPDVPKVTLNLVDYPAQKVELNENDSLELKCVIDANPKAHAIHWRKDVSRFLSILEGHPSSYDLRPSCCAHEIWVPRIRKSIFRAPISSLSQGIALNGGPGLTMRNVMMESERQSSSILLLEDVQADKTTGNYTCVGENLLGRGSSNPLEVRVKCKERTCLICMITIGIKRKEMQCTNYPDSCSNAYRSSKMCQIWISAPLRSFGWKSESFMRRGSVSNGQCPIWMVFLSYSRWKIQQKDPLDQVCVF